MNKWVKAIIFFAIGCGLGRLTGLAVESSYKAGQDYQRNLDYKEMEPDTVWNFVVLDKDDHILAISHGIPVGP